jgi:uroporphyrinogen decarboxylase
MNCLLGKPVDRVPVFVVLGAYAACLMQVNVADLYRDPDLYVAGQVALQKRFAFDLVLAPFDYSALAEAFGGEVLFFADGPPQVKRPAARNGAEALALPEPDCRQARLPVTLDAVKGLALRYQNEVPIIAAVCGPASLPSLVMGMEGWLETLFFDPPLAQALLEKTGIFWGHWVLALLEAGATAIMVTEAMATQEMLPGEVFVEKLLPQVQRMFAAFPGPFVFHGTGGSINHLLDKLSGLPNLLGVVVGSRDDLAHARQKLGPEKLLAGNLDNLALPSFTTEEVYRASLNCLKQAVPRGPFILANSGGDIPLNTPPENLEAIMAAARDYADKAA